MADRNIRVRLQLEHNSYIQGMKRAADATKDFGRDLATTTDPKKLDAMNKLGKGMMLAGAGVAAGLGLAAKAAIDWESAWAGVTKTMADEDFPGQLGEIEKGLRSMARELPASHKEIAAVAEAAGALGVANKDVLGFTRVMVDLGETTNLSADQAATSIAQLMNIMGSAPEVVDRLGATLVHLGNNGASTEREIMDMAARLAGAGKLVGASEADVLSLANALASLGIEAQLGGGAVQRTMNKIYVAAQNGGKALEGFAKVAGMTATEFATLWRDQPIQAFDQFTQGLGRIKAEGGNVIQTLADLGIKGTQDLQVILRLAGAGNLLTRSLMDGRKAWQDNTALIEEAAKRYDTTQAKIEVLRNKLVDFGVSLGNVMLPVIGAVIDAMESLIGFFANLPAPVQTGIAILAGLTATVGLLGGAVLVGIAKWREFNQRLTDVGINAGKTKGAIGLLGKTAGVVGGIMAVVTALNILKELTKPKEIPIGQMSESLIGFGKDAKVSGELAKQFGEDLSGLVDSVKYLSEHQSSGLKFLGGLGPAGDWDKHIAKIDSLDKSLASFVQSGNPELAAKLLADMEQRIANGGGNVDQFRSRLNDYDEALANATVQQQLAGDGADKMGGQFEGAAGDIDTATASVDELVEAIQGYLAELYGMENAQDGFQRQLNDLPEALKKAAEAGLSYTDILFGTSNAAIDVREALQGIVEKGAAVIEQMLREGASYEEVNEKAKQLTESFMRQAEEYGLLDEVTQKYINDLMGIPGEVQTDMALNTSAAYNSLWSFIADANRQTVTIGAKIAGSFSSLWGGGKSNQRLGGVDYAMAKGGIFTRPTVKFAEPETGGELYMPRNGDPMRNKMLAGVAANWAGGQFVSAGAPQFARGGSGGGGVTMVQNVSVNVSATPATDRAALGQEIVGAIRALADQQGTSSLRFMQN